MCNCITEINEQLKKDNTEVDVFIYIFNPEKQPTVSIATFKIDKKVRRGPMRLTATYCPFCGKKYEE
jgi:predicted molibdopterin-dependent oxidoreductase YjgC